MLGVLRDVPSVSEAPSSDVQSQAFWNLTSAPLGWGGDSTEGRILSHLFSLNHIILKLSFSSSFLPLSAGCVGGG